MLSMDGETTRAALPDRVDVQRGGGTLRIAVSGANGFVGVHVVRTLLRDGHEVLALDNLGYGPWRFTPKELERW